MNTRDEHGLERATIAMMNSTDIIEHDWKRRYEQLQCEHRQELEHIRLHYDRELKVKLAGRFVCS
jgi:hypothetical protein